jgi:exosortase F-associated protein
LRNLFFRALALVFAVCTIAAVYLLHSQNIFNDKLINLGVHPFGIFILNKTVRMVINDLACFVMIWALFEQKKYLRLAWYLFLIELLVILPLYFAVKLTVEGDSEISSPLLSQIHRLIVNPVLMFLLIFGFTYQKLKGKPAGAI